MSSVNKPPSIRDVAARVGVSHQTVSRVINGGKNVKPATVDKVQRALDELEYRPNAAARALATSRSKTLGILTTSLQFYGPSSALVGIEQAAREAGYWVSSASIDPANPDSISEVLAHFLSQSIEGLIIIAPQQPVFDALSRIPLDLPFVTLQGSELFGSETMSVNHRAGARLATQHLLSRGHTNIMHIAGPDSWIESRARTQGFMEEMAAYGLNYPEPIVGDWTADYGYSAGNHVIKSRCTAVFCANDHMALGLIHALHDAGIRVPEDISVVGFDDTPESAHTLPPLTTVRQDFAELGRQSVAALVSAISGDKVEIQRTIQPELIIRGSTADA